MRTQLHLGPLFRIVYAHAHYCYIRKFIPKWFLSAMKSKGDTLIPTSLPHKYEYDWYVCTCLDKETQAVTYWACLRMDKMKQTHNVNILAWEASLFLYLLKRLVAHSILQSLLKIILTQRVGTCLTVVCSQCWIIRTHHRSKAGTSL